MKIGIGIDTGGTCTDAVLYDFDTRRVIGSSKTLTTPDNLLDGILEALDGLDAGKSRQAELVGLSTTLATNACVEGKYRPARLLFLGVGKEGVLKNGAACGLRAEDIRFLDCKTTILGQVDEEPDWQALRDNCQAWFGDVEAAAVCEIYAMRNGGVLERKAAGIIKEACGKPVMCASELFSDLYCLERGSSALLNAGLLPVTGAFLQAVDSALKKRGIKAPVLAVRSDGTLMSREFTAGHAVETLLSGPAASCLGGAALTGAENAVVVDMGGTTTDIALIEGGAPCLSEEGIRVGSWRTLARGLAASSFALGGDSAIRYQDERLLIGPERVIPLCVLQSRCPQSIVTLERVLEETPRHSLYLHEFLTLNRAGWQGLPLSDREKALCRALEGGPLSFKQAADALGVDKYALDVSKLEKAGVILRAGLTPTDIMHLRGDFSLYNKKAALLGARFVAAGLGLQVEELCAAVYEEIEKRLFTGISKLLLEHSIPYFRQKGFDAGIEALLDCQWGSRKTGGAPLLNCLFQTPAVLIGIGGPIHLFLGEAAQALSARYVIPQGAETANAVGAVTGIILSAASAEIRPRMETDGLSGFDVYPPGGQSLYFAEEADALACAHELARQAAVKAAREKGAVGEISVTVKKAEKVIGKMTASTYITAAAAAAGALAGGGKEKT